jgi:hypothetical protein
VCHAATSYRGDGRATRATTRGAWIIGIGACKKSVLKVRSGYSAPNVRFAPIFLKNSGRRRIFLSSAGASRSQRAEGLHRFTKNRPGTFVTPGGDSRRIKQLMSFVGEILATTTYSSFSTISAMSGHTTDQREATLGARSATMLRTAGFSRLLFARSDLVRLVMTVTAYLAGPEPAPQEFVPA